MKISKSKLNLFSELLSSFLTKEFKTENIKAAFVIENKLFLDNTIDTATKIIFK